MDFGNSDFTIGKPNIGYAFHFPPTTRAKLLAPAIRSINARFLLLVSIVEPFARR